MCNVLTHVEGFAEDWSLRDSGCLTPLSAFENNILRTVPENIDPQRP
jgi:hypothetical protein